MRSVQDSDEDREEAKKELEQAVRLAVHGKSLFLRGDVATKRSLALELSEEMTLNNGAFTMRLKTLFEDSVRNNPLFVGLLSKPSVSSLSREQKPEKEFALSS